jgi:hypothetical protein
MMHFTHTYVRMCMNAYMQFTLYTSKAFAARRKSTATCILHVSRYIHCTCMHDYVHTYIYTYIHTARSSVGPDSAATVTIRKLFFSFVCLSFCLSSVCLSVCLFLGMFLRPSVFLPVCLSVCLSVYFLGCSCVCLSFCLSVCLSVCPSVHAAESLNFFTKANKVSMYVLVCV